MYCVSFAACKKLSSYWLKSSEFSGSAEKTKDENVERELSTFLLQRMTLRILSSNLRGATFAKFGFYRSN